MSAYTELKEILPKLIPVLEEEGQLDSFRKFAKSMADGKFPPRNIAYEMFLDVAEWYSTYSTTQMQYKYPDTTKFWTAFYRLFHGKGLRFMSGPKGMGSIIDGTAERGSTRPGDSKINVAIPSRQNTQPLEPIFPGINEDMIKNVAASSNPENVWKLGIDGKKINRGKGNKMGDVDCWGHENSPTLQERRERLHGEKMEISNVQDHIRYLEEAGENIITTMHTGIDFKSVVHILSRHIQDLQNQELSIRRTLQRVKDLAGQEWRKSRYYLLISSLSTSKYDVNNHITQGLVIIKSLGFYGSAANGKHADYSVPDLVDLARQENYHTLTTNAYKDTGDTTKMIQRSSRILRGNHSWDCLPGI